MVTILTLLLVSQGNDFRLMAMALGVSKPKEMNTASFAYIVPGRSKADMAGYLIWVFIRPPQKVNPALSKTTPRRHPRVMIVRH
jgi:hypothetical protein